ncbi:MAG: ribulose-phosphate 3-epimerase, partial [Christensenella sp.]|uniref:ribulose-phosphate 3-epimerase n=1 Tax=Christensenella sp. TaxID=1935934 RepID=UPI002B37757C|nr:ribulose-phosphate 3-epimerase [Christensenella sp.]
ALNPATPLNMLEYTMEDIDVLLIMTVNPGFAGQKMIPSGLRKIEKARQTIRKSGCEVAIEADGNVSFENAVKMRAAGTDIFVAGTSALFREDMTIEAAAQKMRDCIR